MHQISNLNKINKKQGKSGWELLGLLEGERESKFESIRRRIIYPDSKNPPPYQLEVGSHVSKRLISNLRKTRCRVPKAECTAILSSRVMQCHSTRIGRAGLGLMFVERMRIMGSSRGRRDLDAAKGTGRERDLG